MAYNPRADSSTASSAAENLKDAEGIIRVANQAERNTLPTNTVYAFPTSGWVYQADDGIIYSYNGTSWDVILNTTELNLLGNPRYKYYSGATLIGGISFERVASEHYKWIVEDATQARLFEIERLATGDVRLEATHSRGIGLYPLSGTSNSELIITDTGATLVGDDSLTIQSPILNIAGATDIVGPQVQIGGTVVPDGKLLGTVRGALAGVDPPSSLPTWFPQTLGDPNSILRVNPAGDNAVWGAGGGGVRITTLLNTTYANAPAGPHANSPQDFILPADFDSANSLVYLTIQDSDGDRKDITLRTDYLASLTGSSYINNIDTFYLGSQRGVVNYRPSTRGINARVGGANPRWVFVGLIPRSSGGIGGLSVTDVVEHRSYQSATTATDANNSAYVDFDDDFAVGNQAVMVTVAANLSGAVQKKTVVIPISELADIGTTEGNVGSFFLANAIQGSGNTQRQRQGYIRFQNDPDNNNVRLRARMDGVSPRILQVQLWGESGSALGATTFLELTDTPNSYTDGEWLRQTPTGIVSVPAPSGTFTPTANSIPASAAMADTLAERQAWFDRLMIPIHETITHTSFVLNAGDRVGQYEGFITSPVTGDIDGRTTAYVLNVGGTRYELSALYQITLAGGTLNNIVLRLSPDPSADINAEWQLQIGSTLFNFSDATTATDASGRVSYSWANNRSEFIESGQRYNCALRIPIVDQFATLPIQTTELRGVLDPSQYGNNSIPISAIASGDVRAQARLRSLAGFGLLTSAGNRVLKYIGTQSSPGRIGYL